MHAKDTVNCLYRLMDLSLSIEELRQALVGIVAQTLIYVEQNDERKALFEILSDTALDEAITVTKNGRVYELAKELTLEAQILEIHRLHV